MMLENSIRRAALAVNKATAILVTAGAGIGVDSGLPDFRGTQGFWKAYPPIEKLGLSFPEVSTPRWFAEDPKFAWGFFAHRMVLYRETEPHHGFQILRNWCAERKSGHFVFTSNIDNQFQKSGFDENKIVECHGTLFHLQTTTGEGNIWPTPSDWNVEIEDKTLNLKSPLPMWPADAPKETQVLLRPNVKMFNDSYWLSDRTDKQRKRFRTWKKTLNKTDHVVVIEIGAGLAVPTVRLQGEDFVQTTGDAQKNCLIRINPRDTDIPRSLDISLPLPGLEALQKIDECLRDIQAK